MTKREFLQAVIATTTEETIKEFAIEEIAKMDLRNESRHNRPSKTAIENEPIKKAIMEQLDGTFKTASEIAGLVEISTQKASALLRQLVEEEKVVATEIKVPKKGKQKGYRVAEITIVVEDDSIVEDDLQALPGEITY